MGGRPFNVVGEYRKVEPPHLLVFTWLPDWDAVGALLPAIEEALAPYEPRPHWGKLFTISPHELRPRYPRIDDFAALLNRHDPGGKFRNAFVERYVAG